MKKETWITVNKTEVEKIVLQHLRHRGYIVAQDPTGEVIRQENCKISYEGYVVLVENPLMGVSE